MTATEILNEINCLPLGEQQKIRKNLLRQTIDDDSENSNQTLWQRLFEEGIITHIPNELSDEDDDFEPIEIEGEPISETIIKDRR